MRAAALAQPRLVALSAAAQPRASRGSRLNDTMLTWGGTRDKLTRNRSPWARLSRPGRGSLARTPTRELDRLRAETADGA